MPLNDSSLIVEVPEVLRRDSCALSLLEAITSEVAADDPLDMHHCTHLSLVTLPKSDHPKGSLQPHSLLIIVFIRSLAFGDLAVVLQDYGVGPLTKFHFKLCHDNFEL